MGMLSSIGPIWPFLRARDQGLQSNDGVQFFLTYRDSGEVTQELLGKTSIFMITFSTNLHIGFLPLRSLRKNGFRNRSQMLMIPLYLRAVHFALSGSALTVSHRESNQVAFRRFSLRRSRNISLPLLYPLLLEGVDPGNAQG